MLPHKGQGLSQGIEDAIALARLLRLVPRFSIPTIVHRFQQFRKARVERIVAGSEANTHRHSMPDGPGQEARDAALKAMGKSEDSTDWSKVVADRDADLQSKEFRKWELHYDVVAEVSSCFAQRRLGLR
jgi:2-polyprenyl-6-methoxyphenol hydroxylase-like FAD-dependent oxidoreductase